MKWVTRASVNVDRVACPWLIRIFVDQEADFIFAAPEQTAAVVWGQGAIPYDASGVALGHHDPECSFDAILKTYGLTDPALRQLALIVRGADTDATDLTPESRGLEAVAEGSTGWRRLEGMTITRRIGASGSSMMPSVSSVMAMRRDFRGSKR
ncbi:MAG: chromate resistance protein [Chloroflexota bacterium]|nr:chromate resistance protein [Chloroflexota bacterium]